MWVVEYSPSQKAWHIHEAEEAAQKNLEMAMSGQWSDWIVVGTAGDGSKASDVAQRLRKEPCFA